MYLAIHWQAGSKHWFLEPIVPVFQEPCSVSVKVVFYSKWISSEMNEKVHKIFKQSSHRTHPVQIRTLDLRIGRMTALSVLDCFCNFLKGPLRRTVLRGLVFYYRCFPVHYVLFCSFDSLRVINVIECKWRIAKKSFIESY